MFGFPRSGTTLLGRLLGAHPQISCPPETNLFSAAGRFLEEQENVEGPHVGVLTGLGFIGFDTDDIMAPFRQMLFDFHEKIAGGRPVWVEKTATDIFHIEALEPFLKGHVRFICMTRNPLDVIGSNMDLAATSGVQLPELFALTREYNSPYEGLASAWVNRTQALSAFVERNSEHCHTLRYEDLVANPHLVLGDLCRFMGLDIDADAVIAKAFSTPGPTGLGDFNIDGTSGIRAQHKNAWRKRLPPTAAARIMPQLAPLMKRFGYDVPKLALPPSREKAMRQYTLASEMKRNMKNKA
ncbi:MAG: sulfotransferase family protein [Paracoccaceae bacterium]